MSEWVILGALVLVLALVVGVPTLIVVLVRRRRAKSATPGTDPHSRR